MDGSAASDQQGTVYASAHHAETRRADLIPAPIDSVLHQERLHYKSHHPDFYTPSLLPFGRPYCQQCRKRVDQRGCAVYLTAKGKLEAHQRRESEAAQAARQFEARTAQALRRFRART